MVGSRSGSAVRAVLALVLAALVAAGCGPVTDQASPSASSSAPAAAPSASDAAPIDTSCPQTSTTSFAKAKFALHAGLAFGAFHRYLWKPFRSGHFGVVGFVKGGLAALFIKREVRLASEDARADPTLCRDIAAPLAQVGDRVQAAVDGLRTGDASGLNAVNSSVGAVESAAAGNGAPITENENGDLTSVPH